MSSFQIKVATPSSMDGVTAGQTFILTPVGGYNFSTATTWALSVDGVIQPILQGGVTYDAANNELTLDPATSTYSAIQVVNAPGYIWLGVGQNVLVGGISATAIAEFTASTSLTISPNPVYEHTTFTITSSTLILTPITTGGIGSGVSNNIPPAGYSYGGNYPFANNIFSFPDSNGFVAGDTYYIWMSGAYGVFAITPAAVSVIAFPCFKEDSKILTDKGYVTVQNLKKGDLVKTSKNGFKPIALLGKSKLEHHANEDRIVNQLYNLSKKQYPDLFEDLVLTGAHAVLVDSFDGEQQKEATVEVLGRVFVTDSKYRLPACVDKRASVYKETGLHTIYHLALENDNYYGNYGIYANGLLVESCSKRILKEISGMTLIE